MLATARGRTCALLLTGAVLLVATACTGDRSAPEQHAQPSLAASTAPAPVIRSAPWRVEVTHVAGTLPVKRRSALTANVRRTVSSYVDAAFLRTDNPTARVDGASGLFARALVPSVRRDEALLTNARLASSTRSVRATRLTAYLSVLAPHGSPAGVTAAVDLVFAVDRGARVAQRVELAGRLLLTPGPGHGWRIFGYDLHRSQRPVRRAS